MADNIQVPKDLDDKIAMRQFFVALANSQISGASITKVTNIYPTSSVPMDTTKYDKAILYSELDMMFKSAVGTCYKEWTFTGDRLDKVEVWEDKYKTVKMYTKTYTYTNDYITKVILTDEEENLTLTKDITIVNGKKINEEVT